VRLKTSAAWGGGAYVMVSVIQPRDPVASPKPRRALGLVYVPLDPKGRKLTVDMGTPVKIDSKAPVEMPDQGEGPGLRPEGQGHHRGGGRGHPAPDPSGQPRPGSGTSASGP
jgi:hypothetical protein